MHNLGIMIKKTYKSLKFSGPKPIAENPIRICGVQQYEVEIHNQYPKKHKEAKFQNVH